MDQRNALRHVVKHLSEKHAFHTLILYGSYARGDATAGSDFDLLAIRTGGRAIVHDTRKWRGSYIDLFIYPENKLKPPDLLRVRGGKVLMQKRNLGDRLLRKVDRLYKRGPTPLPPDELRTRKVWARKMLDRIRRRDIDAEFRRAWLLTSLLEDYFQLRGAWYEGPKLAFEWLRENDPKIHRLFRRALKQPANHTAIKALVEGIIA